MTNAHNQKTIRGVSWNFLRVIVQSVFSLLVMAILARLLPPEDFGLLALALVFIGFAELLSSLGMGPAVIQRKDVSKADIQVAQSLSILVGAGLTLICILCATPISLWYDNPDVELVLVVLAFSLLTSALGAVGRSMLIRDLAFKQLFFIDLIAYVIGYPIVAVTLALKGYGIWSLVWGHMLLSAIGAVLAMYLAKIPLTFQLTRERINKFLNFGVGMSLSSTVNYLAANVDYLIIGRFLGATVLGFYSRAYHLITLPLIKISVTVTSVMFSSMAAIQDDKARVRESFFQALESMTLVTFPILFVFFVAPEIVILGIFGEQWQPAVEAFRILAIAGILKSVFHLSGTVAQATGHVYAELRRQIIYFILLLSGCISFVWYGIEAVAWVTVAASLFLYVSKAQLALNIIEGSWRDYFCAQRPALILSIFVGGIDYLFVWINQSFLQLSHLTAFAILIVLSGIALILGFFFLPGKMMGKSGDWVKQKALEKLSPYMKKTV